MQSMKTQRAALSANHFQHQCSSHSLEAAIFKARVCVCVQYDRSFHTLIPATKCGDAACRRTTSAVKQKMGHQHKHQRHQPIVSLSKYTEFRYTLLSMRGEGGRERGERERKRENDITSLRRGRLFCLHYKVWTPPWRQLVNYTLIEGQLLDSRLILFLSQSSTWQMLPCFINKNICDINLYE